MFDAVLIAGPTASGKSALAISLAQRLNGAVINADSMQVYGDLHVLSARPSAGEAAAVPHLLFGHVDGAVNYSAGLWAQDAACALAESRAMGRLPIFAGGTGLYFRTLLQGLSDIPHVPDGVRQRVRLAAEGVSSQDMHARLAECDRVMAARLRPGDRQRILRALEVHAATGQSLAAFQGRRAAPLLDGARCLALFLDFPRAELFARIDGRFDAMMAQGAREEVAALAARQLDPSLPVMRAHGVPGLLASLRGEVSLEAAIARGKLDTRHYAKRQFTWFRHQMPEFVWVQAGEAQAYIAQAIADAFGRQCL